jgi:hypothetical protein
MFHDLDITLKNILDDTRAPAELQSADVSFQTPDGQFKVDQATVNLFLNEVKENVELRDPLPITSRVNNGFEIRRPPVRVACTYMVSAWSNATGVTKVEEEHRLLGQAFAWLSAFPTIPDDSLADELANQPYPPPTMIAQLDGAQRGAEFWTALGIAPRPSFSLVVTIALEIPVLQPVEAPQVTTISTTYDVGASASEKLHRIGGWVIDSEGKGVEGAVVEVLEVGMRIVTDAAGRYLFDLLPSGAHRLRASAPGYAPAEKTLVVPPKPVSPPDNTFLLTPLE